MPEIWLDVDAALQDVPVNKVALIDDTDFKTREESVVYNAAGMDLTWNFIGTAGVLTQTAVVPTTSGVHDWHNETNGMYSIEIPASAGTINNDSEGFGWFNGVADGVLPWTGPIIGFRAAGLNNLLIDSAFSATRGLTGTAVPAVAAGANTGLPLGDASGRIDLGSFLGTGITESAGGAFALAMVALFDSSSTPSDDWNAVQTKIDLLALTTDVTTAHSTTDALLSSLSAGASGFSLNASGITVTTGTETNAYTDTFSSGTIHILTAAGGITLFEYDFDLSTYIGTATEFIWDGYIQANGDSVDVQYFDWVTSGYLTLMTLSGANGTTIVEHAFDVPVGATGTGANFGLVKLRFTSTSTTNIGTDRVRCVFNVAPGGINNGTTITLDSTQTNKVYTGENWTLALGGQDISGSFFHGANVSGVSSASSLVTFEDCRFDACTLPPGTYRRCGFGLSDGLFTAASAGEYVFVDCYSLVEGVGTPDFTFVGNGASTAIKNRGWKGGAAQTLDANCTMSHEVLLGGTQTITTGGASVELRGTFRAASIVLGTASSETVQIVGVTGPVTITGSPTAATVNVYGVTSSVTPTLSGATINDLSVSRADIELILADTGTDIPALIATAQADLDLITGTDGTTLATAQANYAPNVVVPDAAGVAAQASVCTEGRLAELDAVNLPADVDTLLGRVTAALFSGITSVAEWLGLLGGKQTGDATALTEIKASGAGSGTYDPTTDSQEATRGAVDTISSGATVNITTESTNITSE